MWFVLPGCAFLEKGAGERSESTGQRSVEAGQWSEEAGYRSERSRISELSRSGEHKPAVDAFQALEQIGGTCSPEVADSVSRSRAKLMKADSYVHKALQRRKEGNLLSARANLERALAIYPKYYWVQTLIKNIDSSIQAELHSLKNEAVFFESRGDPERALSRITDAIKLAPEDRELTSEAARLEQLIVEANDEQRILALLDEAREHLKNGRFDEAHLVLTRDDSAERLGLRGKKLQEEVQKRRLAQIRERFDLAVEMEKKGDLETAAGHTLYILELSDPGDPDSAQIVEFARLLGMKFFSTGKLSRAKELWENALVIDPGNQKLTSYLEEVETHLENLDRIKKGGNEEVGE